jgi:hypothetical protein
MSQMMQGPIVTVKPQANVYTVLLIIAILAMGFAAGVLAYDMIQNYGMTFGEIFSAGAAAVK